MAGLSVGSGLSAGTGLSSGSGLSGHIGVLPVAPATWNTTNPPAGITFSNNDTTFASSQGFNQTCIANVPALSGKMCYGISYTGTQNDISVGVSTTAFNPNAGPGDEAFSVGFHTGGGAAGGVFQNGGTINFPYWGAVLTTDTLIVGWDTATNTIEIFKNGTSIGTQVCTALGAAAYPAAGAYGGQSITILRVNSPPAGYTSI